MDLVIYQCHSFLIFSSKQNISFEHSLIYPAKFSKYAKFHENPLQSDEKLKQDPKQGSKLPLASSQNVSTLYNLRERKQVSEQTFAS